MSTKPVVYADAFGAVSQLPGAVVAVFREQVSPDLVDKMIGLQREMAGTSASPLAVLNIVEPGCAPIGLDAAALIADFSGEPVFRQTRAASVVETGGLIGRAIRVAMSAMGRGRSRVFGSLDDAAAHLEEQTGQALDREALSSVIEATRRAIG